ncbi:hypothetical protein GCM10025864_45050 [Luteimicrobium album]|uniref:Scaffolding protein n=1 Tax=Luteimicrobium album TaxID=1054550 RepID=A0ABQ6I8V8_9MICO|nr:hypothetical protein [Luteimicrobium album]GMA22279.1 hypothetical protein GCM10025864_00380 [Luteimicrobium album]GMA26684.1 hypothetical protein GCM10025864_44430 [Luteimicrobium album]GMA26746.1 hypothetical protein GCM10025864_45050 [Luteimicrobium album]
MFHTTSITHVTLPTPGMPRRFERLRFFSAPADAIAGPDGASQESAPGDDGQKPTTPSPADLAAAVQQRQVQQPKGDDGGEWDGKVDSLPPGVQKLIGDLRKEAGDARVNAKQSAAQEARDALAQEIGKALGLVKGDEAPDPAKLAKTAADSASEARQARVELAVFRAAPGLKADPGALLDSRAFLTKVADLDPTDDGFADAVKTAITDAVKDNPKLATQAVGASSVDHAGGTGEKTKPKSLADAVTAAYGQ